MKIKDIFNFISENHKYTEEYIYKNQGTYPVYSATLDKPYGYCNDYEYDFPILLVVNYGDAGKIRIVKEKYSIGRNITGLKLKETFKDSYNLEYLRIKLENLFLSLKSKGNMGVFSQKFLKNIDFEIEKISKELQDEYVKKYKIIKELKEKIYKLQNYIDEIFSFTLKLDKIKFFYVNDIALLNKGSNKISEKMIYENYDNNGISVFSSATLNDGLMGKVSYECYKNFHKKGNKKELTWVTNGYAGKVFYRDTDFLYTEKCGRIVIRNEYIEKILPKFLCYILNQITYSYKTSESNNGKLDIIHMENVLVPIPINSNDEIDIDIQKKIIKKYEKLEFLKEKLTSILKEIDL